MRANEVRPPAEPSKKLFSQRINSGQQNRAQMRPTLNPAHIVCRQLKPDKKKLLRLLHFWPSYSPMGGRYAEEEDVR